MITTVDEYLGEMYRTEVIDRLPERTPGEISTMAALLATTDLKARLATLDGIPDGRCHITACHRRFLQRALALR